MVEKTLVERVRKDFSKVKLKKITVKIPKIKIKRLKDKKPQKDDKIPTSSIVNILIKSAVEKAKREKKKKIEAEEDKSYTILKEQRDLSINGGYGTVSKGYGTTPHTTYVDYGKLFSYLGSFKAKQPYENMAEHVGALNKAAESGSFVLADRETMDKGAFYIRYQHSKVPIDKTSLVPLPGMNSAEWEQFKMWMRLDTTMYLLKISTS